VVALSRTRGGGKSRGDRTFLEPEIMDRLIALSQAYAQRYDSNPLFEMFVAMARLRWPRPLAAVQLVCLSHATQAMVRRQRESLAHTQLRLAANYFGSDAQMTSLIAYASANGGVIVGARIRNYRCPT